MKKTKYIALLLLCFSAFAEQALAQRVNVKKGLIAHYLFNGDAKDVSGNKNHGDRMGSVEDTEDRFGNKCAAFKFNGVDGFVEVPDSKSLSSPTNAFSVGVWLKLKDGTPFSDLHWMTVVCKSDVPTETPNHPQYRLQSTKVTLSINTEFTEPTKHYLNFDEWFYYTLVYDGRKIKAYIDGFKIVEFNYSGNLTPNNAPLNIGRDVPGNEEYYGGVMDDLRIYNRALNADEIQAIYEDDSEKTSPKPCPDEEEELCQITDLSATPGVCRWDGSKSVYDLDLNITYENPPASGEIRVEVAGKMENFPFSKRRNTLEITLEDLPANGMDEDVSVYFTDDTGCALSKTNLYTAPKSCEEADDVCAITDVSALPGKCRWDGFESVYDLTLTVKYENPPSKGSLQALVAGRKGKVSFNARKNTAEISIKGLPADGKAIDAKVSFTADRGCGDIFRNIGTAPDPCDDNSTTPTTPDPSADKCAITKISAAPGACREQGGESVYDLKVKVEYGNAPSSGKLYIEAGGVSGTFPFDDNYPSAIGTLKGLPANGNSVDVVAYFERDDKCARIAPAAYTSPDPCVAPPECVIESISATPGGCKTDGTNPTYDVVVEVAYTNPPATGKLSVKVGNKREEFDIDRNSGSLRETFTGLPADGKPVSVTAYFVNDNACMKVESNAFRAPDPCDYVDAGEINVQDKVTVNSPEITLIIYDNQREDGDMVSIRWDGAWILDKHTLKLRANGPKVIKMQLEPYKQYELVSKAWNLGDRPPNTMTIEIAMPGNKKKHVTINSYIGKSGAVLITYEPD